jgi:hypothetical protein
MEKECPVDFITINENKVRFTALWVLLLVVLSLFTNPLPVFIFLTIDFFLRAFNWGKFSPLNTLSGVVARSFKVPNKPIDQAPKRFAAGIGFALAALVTVLLFAGFTKTVLALTVVFASFALLESFFSFCAGCYLYTFLLYIKLIR